ncbi:MAG: hypothetical protein PVJ36_02395 [Nitrospirota bacterium]|jgi:hypothetical protein
MADVIFNSFKKSLMDGSLDLANDTIKVMLVTSGYTPDADLHDFRDDVTNEVSGTGYTAGGAALSNKSVIQDNADDEGVFDADDVTWSNSTITARGAVVYKDTGAASTSPLICYIDFGADKSSEGADFTIQWNAEGILNVN